MPVSLARRLRRIGYLPKLTIDQIVDANQIKKLQNAAKKPRLQAAILESISQEINHPRAMVLDPTNLAIAEALVRKEWHAKHPGVPNQKPAKQHRRSKSRTKKAGK